MIFYWGVGYVVAGTITLLFLGFLASRKGRRESSDGFVIAAADILTLIFWPFLLPQLILGMLREAPGSKMEFARRKDVTVPIGEIGIAKTELRPSGDIEIDGEDFQAIAESGVIAVDSRVEVMGGDRFLVQVKLLEPEESRNN